MLFLFVVIVAAGAAPAEELGKVMKVATSRFGDVAIEDGQLVIMDGGTHGVQGHTLIVDADGTARWEYRPEGLRPEGEASSGRTRLSKKERGLVRGARDLVWARAGAAGARRFFPDPDEGCLGACGSW